MKGRCCLKSACQLIHRTVLICNHPLTLWLWTEDLQIKESTSNLIQQGQVQATHPDHKRREYFLPTDLPDR